MMRKHGRKRRRMKAVVEERREREYEDKFKMVHT